MQRSIAANISGLYIDNLSGNFENESVIELVSDVVSLEELALISFDLTNHRIEDLIAVHPALTSLDLIKSTNFFK